MSKKLLRKKLALILATLKKKRLYYSDIEYLENKTTADGIETGIYYDWSQEAEVDVVFSVPDTTSRYIIVGSYTGIGLNLEIGNSGRVRMYGNGGTPNDYTTNYVTAGDIVRIQYRRILSRNVEMTVTTSTWTETVTNTNVSQTGTSTISMKLFKDTRDMGAGLKIYKCNIKMGGQEWNYLPVLDWNYTPCMYESITGQLLYTVNSGSGAGFKAGREIHYVDYLESTSDEYVNTGIKFDCANTTIEVKTKETSLTQRHSICGGNDNTLYYFRGTGNWAAGYNATAFNISSYMVLGDNLFKMDRNKLYINGSLVKTYTASSNVSLSDTLLFNRKTDLSDKGPVTMYYAKIWNADVLVRDYIPAIDENGVGYMFDQVTHTIYDNVGSGTFKYPAREIEYLESTGTQYIDTGYIPEVDDKIETVFSPTDVSENSRLFCASDGTYYIQFSFGGFRSAMWFTGGYNQFSSDILQENQEYKLELSSSACYLNNTALTYTNGTNNPNVSILLFGQARTTQPWYAHSKMKYFKIWNNSTPTRDFVPVFKDGQRGMLDKLTGTLYTNQGSGDNFSVGKIVEPRYE